MKSKLSRHEIAMHAASAGAGMIRSLLKRVAPGGLSTDTRLVAEAVADAIDAMCAASESVVEPAQKDVKRSRAARQPVKARQPLRKWKRLP